MKKSKMNTQMKSLLQNEFIFYNHGIYHIMTSFKLFETTHLVENDLPYV